MGYRPHPPIATKYHSLRHNEVAPHRSWAPAHTRLSPQQITRYATTRWLRIVRGLPPTPAYLHNKSLATPQQGGSASFVGSRPHPLLSAAKTHCSLVPRSAILLRSPKPLNKSATITAGSLVPRSALRLRSPSALQTLAENSLAYARSYVAG